ncbi:MAG: phosphoribosylformylglycinamidine synthase [Deltaproteobacteria bacterium]|nr:phosphoribosylformylglycinamidine synthase [Deltaproteobacteria bacterium]
MAVRIEIGYLSGLPDPRGRAVLGAIRSFLGIGAETVRTVDAYLVDAQLSAAEAERVRDCLVDPVTQRGAVGRLEPEPCDFVVSVGYRPGVTDPVGKSALALIEDALGRQLGAGAAVYCSRLYFIAGVREAEARTITTELLANPVVERFAVLGREAYLGSAQGTSVPAVRGAHAPAVASIDLGGPDAALVALSRERLLALSLDEMRAIRDAFADPAFQTARVRAGLGPEPTDAEIECLAQTWSEHCKHKIFNATISYHEPGREPETIRSLFETFIRAPTERIRQRQIAREGSSWLVSVFHDNAGVVAFGEGAHLVYKVETHNTPSALDPYGGAITGIVGVNRDPFGTGRGAELVANVWGYCFADPRWDRPVPPGLLHPRRVREGVHRGVVDGGNQSGIPYARGWELFDERYIGKPLVYCGTVGRLPREVAGAPGHEKRVRPGDRIVMCGGRIGKDGIHGATFSSAELDASSPVQAVQIGDPITQKRMLDFLVEARDLGLYTAITDNGAGGLSSSVGELCLLSGGARLDLGRAPLKYAGLDPWEILISEAQERMTVCVPPELLALFMDLAARREVEATDLGEFTASGAFAVRYGERAVAYLPLALLHDGVPRMRLAARFSPPCHPEPELPELGDFTPTLCALLGRPNLACGERRARHYDHEVQGRSVVKPYAGVRGDVPSDATVLLCEHGHRAGFVLSEGVHPYYADIDTRSATLVAVDEAVRKAVGTGARLDRMAGLDNYCWPDPVQSEKTPDGEHKLALLVRSAKALAELCEAYGVPCISGKDSMKNDALLGGVKISVPPTLLFSVIARIDDVMRAVTVDVKRPGARLYLLGRTREELGASELYRHLGQGLGNRAPGVDPAETLPLYRALEQAIREELVDSCHSPSRGGLAVALFRTALGGRLGLDLDLDAAPDLAALPAAAALFAESAGRFVVSVAPDRAEAFEAMLPDGAFACLGEVTAEGMVRVRHRGRTVLRGELAALERAWKETFDAL